MLEFDVIDKHENKTHYNLSIGEYLVGKGDQCDVILNDPHVSRIHGRILVDELSAIFEDSSTNGTWVQGNRVSGPLTLEPGLSLSFGDLQMLVKFPAESEAKSDADTEFGGQDRTGVKSTSIQESEELIHTKRFGP